MVVWTLVPVRLLERLGVQILESPLYNRTVHKVLNSDGLQPG